MRRILRILVLLVLCFLPASCVNSAGDAPLTASGTVETTVLAASAELGGRVRQVMVNEGDVVRAGDVLVRLDDSILQAQRDIATANLQTARAAVNTAQLAAASAQTQYEIVRDAALARDMPTRTQDWYKNQNGNFTLPEWYYGDTELLKAALAVADESGRLLDDAQKHLHNLESAVSAGAFIQAEDDLAVAQVRFLVAENLYNRVWNGTDLDDLTRRQLYLLSKDAYLESKDIESRWVTLSPSMDRDLRDAAQQIHDDARHQLEDAQEAYKDALLTDSASDILRARAEVSMAEENFNTARDFARTLQTGINAPSVTAAQRALDQANAAVKQSLCAVDQAQASLDMLDVQIARMVVTAAANGVVLNRYVEPGNVVNSGSVLINFGRLDDLTLTVYVPEDRLGEVAPGQPAVVTVDSFVGESFSAHVSKIASQAEFTPRNVQTVEGRKSTVFAVELILSDTGGRLKPGMPADVVFGMK